MSRQLVGIGSNKWIMIASDEVWKIQKRWRLLSFRQLSECLHIDRRTLSKLDHHHPDGTLTLETLDRIYATFMYLCPVYFTPEEAKEEYRRLVDSRIRILMCSEISPRELVQK